MFSAIPLVLLQFWPEFGASPPTVTFDATGVICNWGSGSFAKNISWIELDEVLIVTKAKGPFEEEVSIVLQRDLEHGLAIPKDAIGTQELLGELHRRLPGFDRETVILAMGTTTAGEFRIWQRPRRGSTLV